MSMDTYGIIGFTTDNVGIDRRFYTGRTDRDPTLAVSYNERRVDVYLNGIKLVGDHPGNSDHDYDINSQTGQGSSITLKTGVDLVASDVIECIGYVSLAGNTVTSHNPTPTSGDGGYNEFRNIGQVSSDLLNVYLNGVLLDDSDYTSDPTANGGTVTIGSPTITASDIVVIQVIGTLNNSNFVPAGGGTFTGNVSFGDNNITNVGDIAVDTISSDAGTSIGVTLGTDAGDDFNVGSGKLVVEGDTGKVGIGTASPGMPIHVSSAENNLMHLESTDQDALLKLSDTGGHFQINTANNNTSLGTNGRGEMMRFTGTTGIVFNEDGLDQGFRVESDNNTEALTMDGANGIWGIGTTYGTYALKIDGVGNSGLFTGGVVSCGSLDNRSDERLKENITPLGDSLNTLNQLRPVTFNLTKDVFAGEDFAGFIAQEVKTVFPVAVRGNENETEDVLNEDGEVTKKPVYMGIKMMEMIALLTKSIQELSAKVTALENATN